MECCCVFCINLGQFLVLSVSDRLRGRQPSSHVNYKEEQQIRLRVNTGRLKQDKEAGWSLLYGPGWLTDQIPVDSLFVLWHLPSLLADVDVCFYQDWLWGWCLPLSITISCQVCGRTHGKTMIRYLTLTIRKLSDWALILTLYFASSSTWE